MKVGRGIEALVWRLWHRLCGILDVLCQSWYGQCFAVTGVIQEFVKLKFECIVAVDVFHNGLNYLMIHLLMNSDQCLFVLRGSNAKIASFGD